ncbi:MAG TPA: hypothetical protein VLT33_04635 [Labilithrix sp.]|nr:hypothetical protein [Labilithrix sp.]
MNTPSRLLLLSMILASTSLAGCAAESDEGDDGLDGETDVSALSAAGKALIGSYAGDATFKNLELTARKAGVANAFTADIDTGLRCVMAPCPESRVHVEGTFTGGTKTITFKATTPSSAPATVAGTYKYKVSGTTLTLARAGFTETLTKVAPAAPGPLATCATGTFTQAFADNVLATVAPVPGNTDAFQAPRFKHKLAAYAGRTWTRGADGQWSSTTGYMEGLWGDLYLGDQHPGGAFDVVLHAKTSRNVSVGSSQGELTRSIYFEGGFDAHPGTASIDGPVLLAGKLSESPWGNFGSPPNGITFRGQVRLTDHCFSMLDAPVTASTTQVREVFAAF